MAALAGVATSGGHSGEAGDKVSMGSGVGGGSNSVEGQLRRVDAWEESKDDFRFLPAPRRAPPWLGTIIGVAFAGAGSEDEDAPPRNPSIIASTTDMTGAMPAGGEGDCPAADDFKLPGGTSEVCGEIHFEGP